VIGATIVGAYAGDAITTGAGNTALGYYSLSATTTGANNTAIGHAALIANTTAAFNTGVGKSALTANTTGAQNTAVGYNALLSSTTAGFNTAIGSISGDAITTGASNTTVGYGSGSGITTADNNTIIGGSCAATLSTGANNTIVGASAANSGTLLTTGSDNIVIGIAARTSAGDVDNEIVMGSSVQGTGTNNFTFGNGGTDSNIAFGGTSVTAPSDIRLKEDIQDEEVGLDFINDLRPVTFLWKKEKDVPSEMNVYKADSETRVMNGKYNHGFIAQEVKEVIDNHDLKEGFEMWQEDEADGRQRIGEAALMSVMVKAVQELSAQVEELKTQPKCKCNKE
jgi:hypothetical protein